MRAWAIASVLCAAAAALYGWLRLPVGAAQVESLHEMCANLEMRPADWPCAIDQTRTVAAQVGSSLFTWLAVAASGVLLAASGRRYTWAIPTVLAAVATAHVFGGFEGPSDCSG